MKDMNFSDKRAYSDFLSKDIVDYGKIKNFQNKANFERF